MVTFSSADPLQNFFDDLFGMVNPGIYKDKCLAIQPGWNEADAREKIGGKVSDSSTANTGDSTLSGINSDYRSGSSCSVDFSDGVVSRVQYFPR